MRRAARVDDNQGEIVAALRKIGATVQPIHQIGKGCPDLLVGWRGMNTLLELKDGDKVPSKRKLTQDEVDWHEAWRGQVAVVETVEQAIEAVTK
jgi:hypothetical protein